MRSCIVTSTVLALLLAMASPLPATANGQTVAELTTKLSTGSAAEKQQAADELGRAGAAAKPALAALTKALAGDSETLRWKAARAISSIGPDAQSAVGALTKALGDKSSKVRAYAALALGEIGEGAQSAAPALIKIALDDDPLVRRAVFGALRRIKAPQSQTLPLMVKVLEQGEPAAVTAALATVAEAGEEALPGLVAALDNEKAAYWACIALADMGPAAAPAAPAIVKTLAHSEPEVRMQALRALAEIGPAAESAAPAIVKILNSENLAAVRQTAAYALGSVKSQKQGMPALVKGLDDDDRLIRVVSAWGIAQLKPADEKLTQRVTQTIIEGLKSDDPQVAIAAAQTLQEVELPKEVVAVSMVNAMKSADPELIDNAIHAMASLGSAAAPHCAEALKNDDLKHIAVHVLYRLGPEANSAVPALIEAAQLADDAEFRREIHFALGAIGASAKDATAALADALKSEEPHVRYSACYALGKIGHACELSEPLLRQHLQSDDEFMKLASVWALLGMYPDDADIHKIAVPLLVKGLSNEREHVRAEAATALGKIGAGARSAAPQLKKATQDSSGAVREAATEALKKIQ